MDSTALHELIAQVRITAAELAAAEQRVASFTAELAQQDRGAQPDANKPSFRPDQRFSPRPNCPPSRVGDLHPHDVPRGLAKHAVTCGASGSPLRDEEIRAADQDGAARQRGSDREGSSPAH